MAPQDHSAKRGCLPGAVTHTPLQQLPLPYPAGVVMRPSQGGRLLGTPAILTKAPYLAASTPVLQVGEPNSDMFQQKAHLS